MRLLILDADSLIWKIAYHFSEEPVVPEFMWIVKNRVKEEVKAIFEATECSHYIGMFEDGKGSFRKNIAQTAPYKGTRADKPEWYINISPYIKEALKDEFLFYEISHVEADDMVSILATSTEYLETETIIGGTDKDLLQIPGKHYNYSKELWLLVTPEVADANLWKQVLTGDSSDNIKGIPGIGPKKAEKLLGERPTDEYPFVVLKSYIAYFGERLGTMKFGENFNLVALLTEGEHNDLVPIGNPFLNQESNDEQSDIDGTFK